MEFHHSYFWQMNKDDSHKTKPKPFRRGFVFGHFFSLSERVERHSLKRKGGYSGFAANISRNKLSNINRERELRRNKNFDQLTLAIIVSDRAPHCYEFRI